jgi:hypothetical protein
LTPGIALPQTPAHVRPHGENSYRGVAVSTASFRQRSVLPILVAALASFSLLTAPVQAGEPSGSGALTFEDASVPARDAGSVQGVASCLIEVAATDEVWGATAVVVPGEPLYVYGEGWTPNADIDLTVVGPYGEEYYFVSVDVSGVLAVAISVNRGFYGTFDFWFTDPVTACEAMAVVEVLPMADIADSKFLRDIKWLYLQKITTGCRADEFCPNGSVTRGQMATFLSRALKLPATSTDYFTDDNTNKHESNINRLRAAGITVGCSATRFCPDGLVTRGQMATFLARAFGLPSTTTDYFTDDNTNKHEPNINKIRAAGITSGCGGTRFCPNGIVTRGQMAAFLHRAMR